MFYSFDKVHIFHQRTILHPQLYLFSPLILEHSMFTRSQKLSIQRKNKVLIQQRQFPVYVNDQSFITSNQIYQFFVKKQNDDAIKNLCFGHLFEDLLRINPNLHYDPINLKEVIDFTIGHNPTQTNVSIKIKNGISLYKLEIYGIINAPPKQYLGTSQQTVKNVFSLLKKNTQYQQKIK